MSSVKSNRSILKKFGIKIKELRKQKKLSQEQLASKANLHWTYISGIERGLRNTSLLNILKLARALEITPRELLEFDF